jgi:hypothetical protein
VLEAAERGPSRPASAVTALNLKRSLLVVGSPPLHGNPEVARLVRIARVLNPSVETQSAGITAGQLRLILVAWSSGAWFQLMYATILAVAFQATLRPGEACTILAEGVWWVLVPCLGSREVRVSRSRPDPPLADIGGVILLVRPRKCSKGRPSHLPLVMGSAVRLLYSFVGAMRSIAPSRRFLFPSRVLGGYTHSSRSSPRPNLLNPLGVSAFQAALQLGLVSFCTLSPVQASCYTGYACRVGGTTHYEMSGMDESIRKRLGEWQTLSTARHYLQLPPSEQFDVFAGFNI